MCESIWRSTAHEAYNQQIYDFPFSLSLAFQDPLIHFVFLYPPAHDNGVDWFNYRASKVFFFSYFLFVGKVIISSPSSSTYLHYGALISKFPFFFHIILRTNYSQSESIRWNRSLHFRPLMTVSISLVINYVRGVDDNCAKLTAISTSSSIFSHFNYSLNYPSLLLAD